MWTPPAPNRAASPPSPTTTLSTASSSASIVIATPPVTATSAAIAVAVAPRAVNAAAFAAVRFQTRSLKPPTSRLPAIGVPIAPNPMKPTSSFIFYLDLTTPVRGHHCATGQREHHGETGWHSVWPKATSSELYSNQ